MATRKLSTVRSFGCALPLAEAVARTKPFRELAGAQSSSSLQRAAHSCFSAEASFESDCQTSACRPPYGSSSRFQAALTDPMLDSAGSTGLWFRNGR